MKIIWYLHQWNSILMDLEIWYWIYHNLFLLLEDNKTVLHQALYYRYEFVISLWLVNGVLSTSKQHPVTTSNKACPPKYSQKLLKPCWIRILTSDMALKQQGQKTRWNGDKPHTVLKMPVTLNANRGRVYSSEYKKPPNIWNSDQGCTNCPLRKPHCCSKRLKPFSLTHIFSYTLYLSLCISFQFYSL